MYVNIPHEICLFAVVEYVVSDNVMCSTSAADKLKADKDTPQALKDFGLRISKLLVSVWAHWMHFKT